jgi:flagellar basal-body rod modification protein FlgD
MTTISTTSSSSTPTSQLTGLATDYSTFLKLLTAQMTNQDPLSPMDSAQYTQQLVEYSQVEQQIQQNSSLKDIVSQLSAQQMSQASSFIGKEARFDSAVAGLGSDPATWTYYVNGTPASITGTITDSSGAVVDTVALDPASQGRFEWDGTKSDGTKAADGAYTLSVTATTAGGDTLDTTINSVAKVTDVVASGTDIMLGVNGIRMPLYGLVGVSGGS